MSWNPFKKGKDEPHNTPEGDTAAAVPDDDRTDPLVTTTGFEERVEVILPGDRVSGEEVVILNGGEVASSFLRYRVSDSTLADHLKTVWLDLPDELTGFEDLLTSNDGLLTAKFRMPELAGVPELPAVLRYGVVYRLIHLIDGYNLVARLLQKVYDSTGLVWPGPDSELIGLEFWPEERGGKGSLLFQFLDWNGLQAGDLVEASRKLWKLFDGQLEAAKQDAAEAGLGIAHDTAAQLQDMLAPLSSGEFSYGQLDELLSRYTVGTRAYGLTDVGVKRDHNEDAYMLLALSQRSSSGGGINLAAVADGMGGHASGEVASSLTLSLLRQHLLGTAMAPSSQQVDPSLLKSHLESAIPAIDRALQERAAMAPELAGMGTTLVGYADLYSDSTTETVTKASTARIFWVGDSRAYLIGSWGMAPLTSDHSHVNDLLAAGSITPEEARTHKMKNVITRCLGGSSTADGTPDVTPFGSGPGELILLCSDGLSDVLTDDEIFNTVCSCGSDNPQDMAQALVDAANAGGGPDNITVVLIECRLQCLQASP